MSDEQYAGVDLGGTTITAGIATADGRLVASRTIPTDASGGPDVVLGRITLLIESLAAETGAKTRALGVGLPGLVDVVNGEARFLPNLTTQWRGVPVAATLSAQLRCPVWCINDARAAALGELTYGHGRDARTMAFYTLGTGIGGGVAIEGKLLLGKLGAAGELGHMTILPDGPRCGCGNRGCLETLASGPAIAGEGMRLLRSGLAPELHRLTDGNADRITPRTMADAAAAGDVLVREVMVRAAGFLGIGVANIVTALHPDLIVLGGGVAGIGPLLFDEVRRVVADRVRMFPTDGVRIEPSALGEAAGLLGAVALAARSLRGDFSRV
jgi:glucokinase